MEDSLITIIWLIIILWFIYFLIKFTLQYIWINKYNEIIKKFFSYIEDKELINYINNFNNAEKELSIKLNKTIFIINNSHLIYILKEKSIENWKNKKLFLDDFLYILTLFNSFFKWHKEITLCLKFTNCSEDFDMINSKLMQNREKLFLINSLLKKIEDKIWKKLNEM